MNGFLSLGMGDSYQAYLNADKTETLWQHRVSSVYYCRETIVPGSVQSK